VDKQAIENNFNSSRHIRSDHSDILPDNGGEGDFIGVKPNDKNLVGTEGVQRPPILDKPGGQLKCLEGAEYGELCHKGSSNSGRGDPHADLASGEVVSDIEYVDGFLSWKVDKSEVGRWWPLIRPGVEKVIKKTSPSFLPEDVYMHIKQDLAWLIIAFTKEDKKFAGFVIVSRAEKDPFSGREDLLLWIAYSEKAGAVESTLKKVEVLGKSLGFNYVIFHSSRKGWVRRAESLGFHIRERVYSKKL
jgi:hypothetical protein